LAILLFAAIYAVLAGRLVMFAVGADSHGARRAGSQDAIATARPDIVDRNGEVLATDVKAPSLFGEPRRIIDKDEAIELLTAALPDLDTIEARTRLSSRKGFVWLEARDQRRSNSRTSTSSAFPHRLPAREQAVYPTGAAVAHLIGLVNIDNQGIAGWRSGWTITVWPICTAPALPPIACSAPWNCRSTCASNMRCAMSC